MNYNMDSDSNPNPNKRPRSEAIEELHKVIHHKDGVITELKDKLVKLMKDHEKLQKNYEVLMNKIFINGANVSSNEEDMLAESESDSEEEEPQSKNQANAEAGTSGNMPKYVNNLKEVTGPSRKPATAPPTGKRSSKSVPIITTYDINIREIRDKLKSTLGHQEFNMKLLGKNVTNIGVCTLEDFSKLKALLKAEKVNFFTHTPKAERPFSVVVRGLSETYSKDDILEYMQGLQFNCNVVGLHRLSWNKWLFQLGRDSDLKAFRNIRYIIHCRVSMEKHQRRDIIQCYNCQRFGHIAINCNMPYRCVKCSGTHGPANCTIPPKAENIIETPYTDSATGRAGTRIGIPTKCANCGTEGHTSNYRNCPKRLELLRKLSLRRQGSTTATPVARSTSIAVPGVSYAAAARTAVNTPTAVNVLPSTSVNSSPPVNREISLASARSEFSLLDRECKELLGDGLLSCLKRIGTFAREFRTLTNRDDKTEAMLGMLLSFRHDG